MSKGNSFLRLKEQVELEHREVTSIHDIASIVPAGWKDVILTPG